MKLPDVSFEVHSGKMPYVYIRVDSGTPLADGDTYSFSRKKTPRECFDAAWDVVRSLPDPKVAVAREYTRKLADAVDFAVLNALPDAAVSPVRDAIRVVHDVLLPAPENVQ
jgi:hypothetical protein